MQYMDRVYVKHQNKAPVHQLGLDLWRDLVLHLPRVRRCPATLWLSCIDSCCSAGSASKRAGWALPVLCKAEREREREREREGGEGGGGGGREQQEVVAGLHVSAHDCDSPVAF